MSEFINVTEVEKLPINKIDSLIAIDANKNIKRTSITVDQEIDADSTNPISSKGVYDALAVLGNDVTDIRNEIAELSESIGVDVEKFVLSGDLGWEEISNLQFTTGNAVDYASRMSNGQQCDLTILLNGEMSLTPTSTVVENGNVGILLIMGVDVYSIYISADGEIVPEFLAAISSDFYTKEQTYDKQQIDFKISEVDRKFDHYATTLYVNGLIGDINTVLDQINGEVI